MKTKSLSGTIAIIAVVAVASCLHFTAHAQTEADRTALRMIRTNYMEAVNSGDPSKLAPNLSKDVTAVMVTGEQVTGLDGLQHYWKKVQDLIGPGGGYRVTVNTDKTDLFNDIAVSRGSTEDVVRLGNGKELRFGSYWTAVCHKEEGVWKVLRMEAAMDPVDNVFINLKLEKTKWVYGIAGIIVGVLLMLVINFLRNQSRRSPVK